MWHIEVCGSLLWAVTFQNVGDSVVDPIVPDHLFVCLFEREREREWGEDQRERERKRISSRLPTECRAWRQVRSHDPETMT